MTNGRIAGRALRVLAGAIAAFVLPAPASAQAVCTDINSVPGFKIVLDDIQFAATPPDDQKVLMRLLISQLGSRLEDLPDPAPSRYHLVPCPGRIPVGEASFPPLTVRDLVTRDVLLEVLLTSHKLGVAPIDDFLELVPSSHGWLVQNFTPRGVNPPVPAAQP